MTNLCILSRLNRDMKQKPFRSQTMFYIHLTAIGKLHNCNVYIFPPENYNNGKITGYFFDNTWKVKENVIPDVIYDRGFFKRFDKNDNLSLGRKIREDIITTGLPVINQYTLLDITNNKKIFADFAKKYNIPHPNTDKFSKQNLIKFFEKNCFVLKPYNGSQGDGIIYYQNGNIRYKVKTKKNNVKDVKKNSLKVNGFDDTYQKIVKVIQEVFKKNLDDYIIQDMIDCYMINGKETDFRILLNRDKTIFDVEPAIVSRVGGNLSQDGEPEICFEIFRKFVQNHETNTEISLKSSDLIPQDISLKFSTQIYRQCLNLYNELVQLSINTLKYLDIESKGYNGDIAIDIILDNNGKFWVIEANSKPGRALYRKVFQKYNNEIYNKYYKNKIDFSNNLLSNISNEIIQNGDLYGRISLQSFLQREKSIINIIKYANYLTK